MRHIKEPISRFVQILGLKVYKRNLLKDKKITQDLASNININKK